MISSIGYSMTIHRSNSKLFENTQNSKLLTDVSLYFNSTVSTCVTYFASLAFKYILSVPVFEWNSTWPLLACFYLKWPWTCSPIIPQVNIPNISSSRHSTFCWPLKGVVLRTVCAVSLNWITLECLKGWSEKRSFSKVISGRCFT